MANEDEIRREVGICPLLHSDGDLLTCRKFMCRFWDTERQECVLVLSLKSIYTPTVLLFEEGE